VSWEHSWFMFSKASCHFSNLQKVCFLIFTFLSWAIVFNRLPIYVASSLIIRCFPYDFISRWQNFAATWNFSKLSEGKNYLSADFFIAVILLVPSNDLPVMLTASSLFWVLTDILYFLPLLRSKKVSVWFCPVLLLLKLTFLWMVSWF
jgi:hypothetical protein